MKTQLIVNGQTMLVNIESLEGATMSIEFTVEDIERITSTEFDASKQFIFNSSLYWTPKEAGAIDGYLHCNNRSIFQAIIEEYPSFYLTKLLDEMKEKMPSKMSKKRNRSDV